MILTLQRQDLRTPTIMPLFRALSSQNVPQGATFPRTRAWQAAKHRGVRKRQTPGITAGPAKRTSNFDEEGQPVDRVSADSLLSQKRGPKKRTSRRVLTRPIGMNPLSLARPFQARRLLKTSKITILPKGRQLPNASKLFSPITLSTAGFEGPGLELACIPDQHLTHFWRIEG